MSFPIIHHNGAFNLWNTEWDKPCFPDALNEDELTAYIKEHYGTQGLRELPRRLERAKACGTSHMLHKSLESHIRGNRAGKGETQVSPETIIRRHLTLRTAPVERRYTVTCVCGVSVRTKMTVRLKDPSAIEHEGNAHVRMCPGCHPEMFQIHRLPNWWIHREPAEIPAKTQAQWDAEDQKRRDRMRAAVNRRKA